ncbi:hypothetical protein BT96DRAFT_951152 [Gymnopus androsaceus JB14]|uniref:CCHC-type domain-containing protein n=1 Tax=Gymnopus androsaceus JB14 TaxID=1447944 RepID=A0A6A4GE45_9AGAR|nr:hypothetical protein BT96DRAFT_951152 [Gymnopus androsaceus JB14]
MGGEITTNKNSNVTNNVAAPKTQQNNYANCYNRFNNAGKNASGPSAQAKLADTSLNQSDNQPQEVTTPVSREEWNCRMREGLCIHCGKPGHIGRDHNKGVVLKGATSDYCSCEDCEEDCTCCNEIVEERGPIEARAAFTVTGDVRDDDVALILELEVLEMETRFEKQGNTSETQAKD